MGYVTLLSFLFLLMEPGDPTLHQQSVAHLQPEQKSGRINEDICEGVKDL